MRKHPFANGELYHIYNRGVEKRAIALDLYDQKRFFQSLDQFNTLNPIGSIYEKQFLKKQLGSRTPKSQKLVHFIAYCLNPNHYHFILEQIVEKGIEKFMQRFGTGYTNYFNAKYKRNGPLFQGNFKSIHVDSNEYLLHLSAYVNLNNRVHALDSSSSKRLKSKTSWGEYITDNSTNFCKKDIILQQFRNIHEYKHFAESSLSDILARKHLVRELEALFLES